MVLNTPQFITSKQGLFFSKCSTFTGHIRQRKQSLRQHSSICIWLKDWTYSFNVAHQSFPWYHIFHVDAVQLEQLKHSVVRCHKLGLYLAKLICKEVPELFSNLAVSVRSNKYIHFHLNKSKQNNPAITQVWFLGIVILSEAVVWL